MGMFVDGNTGLVCLVRKVNSVTGFITFIAIYC